MSDVIRWGILATGGIAHAFTSDLRLNGLHVQAVGSRSQSSARSFAGEFGIPTAHASYAALAEDPDVDVIYISTPHPFHAENAMLALNAGKHVLIEKPMTLNAAQARAVVDLARSKGLVVQEAMWTRFLPHMARIRELIAAGTIGEVRTLIADHAQKLPDDPAHRLNAPELGGGALLDLGIYPVSFASALFGQPREVLATATFRQTGVDARIATVFRYPGGGIATIYCASDTRGPNRATVLGSEGRIEIEGVWYSRATFRCLDAQGGVIESFEQPVTGRGLYIQALEVERLIRAGMVSSEVMPPEESVQIMETLDAVRTQIGLRYPGE